MEKGKTIKQIADELGVTKQAIRNEIAKQKLQSTLQKNANQLCISESAEILIKSAILERRSANLNAKVSQSKGAKPSEELFAAKTRIVQLELELKLQKAHEKEKIEIYIAEAERLMQELHAKDEIINAQLQQLSDLYKLSAQAQALHAGTIQHQLISDGADPTESELQTKKKHWWQKNKPTV